MTANDRHDTDSAENGGDGVDGEPGDTNRIDRRDLLATLGATAGTTAFAGCLGGDGGTSRETREFEARDAAFDEEGAKQLGVPRRETKAHETSRNVSVGDEEYRVNSTHKLTTFPVDEPLRYDMGILSSPLARIDGTITSPVANRDLLEFLTSQDGKRLLQAMGAPTDWMRPPTRRERVGGADRANLWRDAGTNVRETPIEVYEWAHRDGESIDTWYVALIRGREVEDGEETVVLACVGGGLPSSVPAADRVRDLVHLGAPNVTLRLSERWDSPAVPRVEVTDLRLVQTVENSKIHREDEADVTIPDPPIVAGEPAAALFDLEDVPNYSVSSSRYLRASFQVDVDGTPVVNEEIDIVENDVKNFLGQSTAQLFDEINRSGGPWSFGSERTEYDRALPVFSVDGDDVTVSVDVRSPLGWHVDGQEISLGSDFELTSVPTLRVGFIEVIDPGGSSSPRLTQNLAINLGKKYTTDIDWGDANGRAKNYERSVRSSYEFIRRVYPGDVVAYMHDTPMVGLIRENWDDAATKDAKRARSTLNGVSGSNDFPSNGTILAKGLSSTSEEPASLMDADEGGGFDVRVMILPKGTASDNGDYFDLHWGEADEASSLLGYHWNTDTAVGSLEALADSNDLSHATTTAQEIGHRFSSNPYDDGSDDPFSRTADIDDDGDPEDDRSHANQNLQSVGYDLTGGAFDLISSDLTLEDGDFESGRVDTATLPSYMSYVNGVKWADNRIHSFLVEGKYGVSYGGSGDGSGSGSGAAARRDESSVQPVLAGYGSIVDGEVQFEESWVHDAVPADASGGDGSAGDSAPVEIELHGPDEGDEPLVDAVVADSYEGTHHRVHETPTFSLPFPELGVSLVATRGDTTAEMNPIIDPLRDALARVPASGAVAGEDGLAALRGILDDAAELMDESAYGDAARMLDGPFREAVRAEVREEYDRFAGEPRTEELTALTQRMVDRLDVIAEEQQGNRLACGTSLPPNITEDTTLQEGCTYTVTESGVKITDGTTLAIEPGVEIEVAADVSINVTEGGAFTARGTEDNPIEIRGSVSAAGYWKGIEIQSDDPANELSHVTVAHAGDVYWDTAITVYQRATIQNCTVRESSSTGIKARKFGTLVDFRDNHIENVEGPAMRLHPNQIRSLSGTTTFENIGAGHILVQRDMAYADERVVEDGTWPAMGLPYEFTGTTTIESDIDIEEGATLQFQEGSPTRLFVANGGRMVAEGTAERPITYRGAVEAPGYWGGIFIQTPTDNVLDNVVVRDAGGGYREANVGVGIDGQGSLTVRNSTIANGASAGIKATGRGDLLDFQDNRFENMQGPPLYLHPEQLRSLTGTATFASNEQSHVLVFPNKVVTEDGTWPAMDVPYEFKKSATIESDIDIEDGATLQFRPGGPFRLYVANGGRMVAEGTAERPITYRGVEDTPDAWGGIFIQTPTDNVLDNVVVSDGGGGYRDANIGVGIDGQGKLTVTDSEIRDSAGWGIILSDGTLTAENNTYQNNASGDVKRPDE